MFKHSLALLAVFILTEMVQAADINIEYPRVRATVPGQKVAGAFMDITANRNMELVAGATPVSASVELHFMRMAGGEMEMRELKSIKLPKGKTVNLEPGGLHVMLIGLNTQLKAGEQVPLALFFRDVGGKRSKVDVTLKVFTPGE